MPGMETYVGNGQSDEESLVGVPEAVVNVSSRTSLN